MLGGLLTLSVLALLYALIVRNPSALRYLLFVAVTGASSLMRTGLPDILFPNVPPDALLLLKVCAGPLSAALVIYYLGIFLGGAQEDPLTHQLTTWFSRSMLLAALALGMALKLTPEPDVQAFLRATAGITVTAVLMGLCITIRAMVNGDPLGRWVVLANLCLGVAVLGLGARGLNLPGFGLGTWALTAVCTVSYFLVGSIVVMLRIRKNRELDRLSRLTTGNDPATDLPTGSVLLSEVSHAFWRTARLGGKCTVICLRLNNLYQLAETAGREVEAQILSTMAARIRRAAGFRCVVGLYHPHCFVVVISAFARQAYVGHNVKRLRSLSAQGLTVTDLAGHHHDFWPRVGMGLVEVRTADASPMELISEAERLALGPVSMSSFQEDDIATLPSDRYLRTDSAPLST